MGLGDQIMEAGYHPEEVRFVDDAGRRMGGFPTEVL